MNKIRTAVAGFGNMGKRYANYLYQNQIDGMELAGICCRNQSGQQFIHENFSNVSIYPNDENMLLCRNEYDAVIIATPHKEHIRIAEKALTLGIYVLCEKPLGICTKEARNLISIADKSNAAFAMIFNWRTRPAYCNAKELLDHKKLGRLTRVVWIANLWYRTPAYHRTASWRSSWNGEGGGVLINQSQHILDIWQWLFGRPDAVRAIVDFGKFNPIPVDDNADIIFEYRDGCRGFFATSTGESPGSNYLEIHGSNGKLIIDKEKITLYENIISTEEFALKKGDQFTDLPYNIKEIKTGESKDEYITILQNFSDHIRKDVPLIAPGSSGIIPLEMANGAYLSSWLDKRIEFPIDDIEYEKMLHKQMESECFIKYYK